MDFATETLELLETMTLESRTRKSDNERDGDGDGDGEMERWRVGFKKKVRWLNGKGDRYATGEALPVFCAPP